MILIIVPLICLFIVVVFLLYGIGGVQYVMSADRPQAKAIEDMRARLQGAPVSQVDTLKAELSKKFRTRLADIAAGKSNTAQTAGELKNLGVSLDKALKNPDHALDTVLEGLARMKSTVGQSSATTCIFGSVLSSKLMAIWHRCP